ncbi:MAG: tetratricopeptide repeat protein [Paracoccaceae bacterium]
MTLLRSTALLAALALGACAGPMDEPPQLSGDDQPINVIDASSLNELMLTVSDPDDAVSYFQRALNEDPGRVDYQRGYALALARARRYGEAAEQFEALEQDGAANDRIRIEHAHSLARLERWPEADAQMAQVSAGADSARRYLIDAMLADQRSDWTAADIAYEQARRHSANPARILNNWGVSKMSRGETEAAAKTFEEALSFDPRLFNAKNNLAVARALKGEYRLPLVSMTEVERAIMLHNIGVIALRRGDVREAKGLFTMAIAAHPQYYPEAAEKLAALEASVLN